MHLTQSVSSVCDLGGSQRIAFMYPPHNLPVLMECRYESPEFSIGQLPVTPASDLWGVGIITFELYTSGRHPFHIHVRAWAVCDAAAATRRTLPCLYNVSDCLTLMCLYNVSDSVHDAADGSGKVALPPGPPQAAARRAGAGAGAAVAMAPARLAAGDPLPRGVWCRPSPRVQRAATAAHWAEPREWVLVWFMSVPACLPSCLPLCPSSCVSACPCECVHVAALQLVRIRHHTRLSTCASIDAVPSKDGGQGAR